MKSLLLTLVLAFSFKSTAAWAARSTLIPISEDGKQFQGILYVPDNVSPGTTLPVVIVVHEWWGKTDYPEMRAKKVADELGYAALAVDLYGFTAASPANAKEAATPFYGNPSLGRDRIIAFIEAAPAAAKKLSAALDLKRIAAIGYCFGGAQVLNLARAGDFPGEATLLGVVSFHGSLSSALEAKQPISARVLVLHGDADASVKPEEVSRFKEEMKKAGADLKFVSYPGATHAFTNPKATENGRKFGLPIAYDASADSKSWTEMKAFLQEIFKNR